MKHSKPSYEYGAQEAVDYFNASQESGGAR